MHDPRLGRFFAIDPLASEFVWNSPYSFSQNRLLDGIELEGAEWIHYKIIFVRNSKGDRIVLDKITMEDFRNKTEKQMNEIHHTSNFYSKYSKGFGTEGPGVQYTYEEQDSKGNVIGSRTQMELESSLTRYGFYAGRGSVTKYGEELTSRKYGNYDFGMDPIDMVDALSKEHDYLQNVPGHKGFMHTDYLNSDVLFFSKLNKFKNEYENNPNYIDPFTNRPVSQEAKDFTENAMDLFSSIIALKVFQLGKKLENGKISQDQYDKDMYLFKNTRLTRDAPLPKPTDKGKFKEKS